MRMPLRIREISVYTTSSAEIEQHKLGGGCQRKAEYAGVAQLVERNLAKVEVESSSLFSRSKLEKGSPVLPFFCLEY